MSNRLEGAVSPYLRLHADNPVDWWPWGSEAFDEARRRQVPVLVSIGYATCHWCHVMARESFSDPALADYLNAGFVAVKVDREEHPDVDASYLAAASAFTRNLGWPLNVFVTPDGRPFYAGTYWPPSGAPGQPAFHDVLRAVRLAWSKRRDDVERTGDGIVAALAGARPEGTDGVGSWGLGLPAGSIERVVEVLEAREDPHLGGFGTAPKFPVVPVLELLLDVGAGTIADGEHQRRALDLARRTLVTMAASPLRDVVEGGFFRYATRRDWSEPHYERMLYDNAQLLSAYTTLAVLAGEDTDLRETAVATADGVARFLTDVMQLPDGGFASAQDSESTVDGERVEGGYYALDAVGRARQAPPALDEKVLAGWNGLAIEALARAGHHLDRPDWLDAARRAADYLLLRHVRADGSLVRVSIGGRASTAVATLEDYGALAVGLVTLGCVVGEPRYLVAARGLVDRMLGTDGGALRAPEGVDPVLAGQGLGLDGDPSEGAYPSGLTIAARAADLVYRVTAQSRYREAAATTLGRVAGMAVEQPMSLGAALRALLALEEPTRQLVVVGGDPDLARASRAWYRPGATTALVSARAVGELEATGFELFAGRDRAAAFLCEGFVCRLPVTSGDELDGLLAGT